jgi:hypothetical protein
MTQATQIHRAVQKLFEALGPKAIAEAAQKAKSYEAQGQESEAQTWRRIERGLLHMRGPRAS